MRRHAWRIWRATLCLRIEANCTKPLTMDLKLGATVRIQYNEHDEKREGTEAHDHKVELGVCA